MIYGHKNALVNFRADQIITKSQLSSSPIGFTSCFAITMANTSDQEMVILLPSRL